jgi:hypothetical protein
VLLAVALAALLPRAGAVMIGGGGLFGHLGYDGAVYYAAAAGVVSGQAPYRDFLLLHPPGVVVSLLPFAGLGRVIGDPWAMAVARVAWMAMGAGSAVVAAITFRRYGAGPALVAGLSYAVFVPAIRVEHSTTLEAPGSLCVLIAIALLTRPSLVGHGRLRDRIAPSAVIAGCLLGFACGLKIWGVVIATAVVVWCLVILGHRVAGAVAAGFVATVAVVCLPFFLSAPQEMWRMVVIDQLGRGRDPASVGTRLLDVAGLFGWSGTLQLVVLGTVATVALAASALAWRIPAGQLGVVLLAPSLLVLLTTPPWSHDYGALVGPAAAAIAGGAAAALVGATVSIRSLAVTAALLMIIGGYVSLASPGQPFGHRFPGASLAVRLADVPGCITTDDPTLLIETNLLQRNLSRGCSLVVDLGGYSYHLQPGASAHVPRKKNRQWQRFALDYLADGRASVIVRFDGGTVLSARTRRTIESWPIRSQVGRYVVRSPS